MFLLPNGSWFYPDPVVQSATPANVTAGIAIPVGGRGHAINITLPGELSSGRVWFALGSLTLSTALNTNGDITLIEPSVIDPSDSNAAVSWDFIEFTYSADDGLFANISYVDFVGLALGMSINSADGDTQIALGLSANATTQICDSLKTQASSSSFQPWAKLCVTNDNIQRILSPSTYISINPPSNIIMRIMWVKSGTYTGMSP